MKQKRNKAKKQGPIVVAGMVAVLALLACVVCLLVGVIALPKGKDATVSEATAFVASGETALTPIPTHSPPPKPVDAPRVTETPAKTPFSTDRPPYPRQTARVVQVIDGDTIEVEIDGQRYRVRYIGIDCPEQDEPFHAAATEANRLLVAGQLVEMEKDVSETDRYGRLLRYVYIGDLMVNAELVRLGVAQAVTYPPDVSYADHFRALQQQAQAAGVGLWGASTTGPRPTDEISSARPSAGRLAIVQVNDRDEYVDIQNKSDTAVDLIGWHLLSERGTQDCPLGGEIQPGEVLRVWALEADAGMGGYNCGFGSNIWNNSGSDPAILYDPDGAEVSRAD